MYIFYKEIISTYLKFYLLFSEKLYTFNKIKIIMMVNGLAIIYLIGTCIRVIFIGRFTKGGGGFHCTSVALAVTVTFRSIHCCGFPVKYSDLFTLCMCGEKLMPHFG